MVNIPITFMWTPAYHKGQCWVPWYFYSTSTTYQRIWSLPWDYLQMTVSCTDPFNLQRIKSNCNKTSTPSLVGQTHGAAALQPGQMLHNVNMPNQSLYSLCGNVLAKVTNTKYLGITNSEDLPWHEHVATTSAKANKVLKTSNNRLTSA